ALPQACVSQALRPRGECVGRAAPLELVHVAEERRVGPECRQLLEQQRPVAVLPEDGGREVLDDAVLVQEPCCRDRAYPRNAGIPVGRVAHEREEVGDQAGSTPNLSRTAAALRILCALRSTCTTRSPRTHCARSLSGVQMQTCCTRSSWEAIQAAEASASSASSSIMGHTTTPRTVSASSRGWNWASRAGSTPSPVL